jgi:hypothetical protein
MHNNPEIQKHHDIANKVNTILGLTKDPVIETFYNNNPEIDNSIDSNSIYNLKSFINEIELTDRKGYIRTILMQLKPLRTKNDEINKIYEELRVKWYPPNAR